MIHSMLEGSSYVESLVLYDPGRISVEHGVCTGTPIMFFTPKFGLEAKSPRCVASATTMEELQEYAAKIMKRRAEIPPEKLKKYLDIEEALDSGDTTTAEKLRSNMNDVQKDRLDRMKKRK